MTNLNTLDVTRMLPAHIRTMQANAAERGSFFDFEHDACDTKHMMHIVKIVGETEKAWKVYGYFTVPYYMRSKGGEIVGFEKTTWLPKSMCSIVVDEDETAFAIVPNWLVMKAAKAMVA